MKNQEFVHLFLKKIKLSKNTKECSENNILIFLDRTKK